ncbi:MAG: phosphatase PAP2 family protein, partial [Desulfovibrio sp.]|nr:phosphatase PAP2 family protein [Desulfovibrio sp.]
MIKKFLFILFLLTTTSICCAQEIRQEDFSILLPPPPENGSLQQELDTAAYEKGKIVRATPRGAEAVLDADFSLIMHRFSASFGHEISLTKTPAVVDLLKYSNDKLYYEIIKVYKNKYKRKKPYILYQEETCYKNDENNLYADHSYPSGHSASAWIIALILTELAPERAGHL